MKPWLTIAAVHALLMTAATMEPALAQQAAQGFTNGVVKLGILSDMSGPYSDYAGNGSVIAVQMAVEDFGGKIEGTPIEVVSADHQNKSDIGTSIARSWYDRDRVDAVFDISNSAVALAVMSVTQEKNRIVVLGGVSTPKATTDSCTPNSIQYVYDSNALANVVGRAVVRNGGDSWYFMTTDFAFGHGLEAATSEVVKSAGGRIVGSVRFPLNTADFSSYLLQAQASGAKIIALASSGGDTVNAIKSAAEFGVGNDGRQNLVTLLNFISDVHSMGLQHAQGLFLATSFYWDRDEESRKFARRFYDRAKKMPTMVHAGMYSAATHYLRSVASTKTDETATVMKQMKSAPIEDFFSRGGQIRADGLHVHDMYLMNVKKPENLKYPWDYYNPVSTVTGQDAFLPMSSALCKMLR